jgi:hypothetical protein
MLSPAYGRQREECTIDIVFRYEKPRGDRKQRKATEYLWVGYAERYGEIEIWRASRDRLATVSGAGLPPVEVRHPDGTDRYRLPLDLKTVLLVGGTKAVLTPGRGRSRAERAVRIELGARQYTYGVTSNGQYELRAADGRSLVRRYLEKGVKGTLISTSAQADEIDLALALAFLTLDTSKLTLSGTIIGGVVNFLTTTHGESSAAD